MPSVEAQDADEALGPLEAALGASEVTGSYGEHAVAYESQPGRTSTDSTWWKHSSARRICPAVGCVQEGRVPYRRKNIKDG